jgi:hypothetical protein
MYEDAANHGKSNPIGACHGEMQNFVLSLSIEAVVTSDTAVRVEAY